jgi:hypothetical protein
VQNGGFDELAPADEVAADTAAITLAIATVAVVTPSTPTVLPSSATFFSNNCFDDSDDDDCPLLEVLLLLPLLQLQLLSNEDTEASSLADSVDTFSTPDLASLTGTKDDDTAAAFVEEVAMADTFSVGFSTT